MSTTRLHPPACVCDGCKDDLPFEIPADVYKGFVTGNVVLFVGAGVSTESTKVLPFKLYDDICRELEIPRERGVPFPDVMSTYCARPNGRANLLRKIKDRLDYVHSFPNLHRQATAFHRELSTVPSIENIVTTNWDAYFEQECGATPFVTAEDFAFAEIPGRKVFKIHGSIDSYGSIVATRQDYEACYERLSTGLLGSKLKVLLATKTVVYIGFSFSDDDFIRIHAALTAEMRGLRPHSYIVSPHKSIPNDLQEKGLTQILTDGTFFIRRIKERMVADKHMLSDDRFDAVETLLEKVLNRHEHLSNVSASKYPDVIFGMCYQDGLIDSLERALAVAKAGKYSAPAALMKIVETYEMKILPEKLRNELYHSVAYIAGYVNGLLYLLADNRERKEIPMYFAFGEKPIRTLEAYVRILNKLRTSVRDEHRWAALQIKKRRAPDDFVFHHIPLL
jgi:hypothetical protein